MDDEIDVEQSNQELHMHRNALKYHLPILNNFALKYEN